MRSFAPLRKKGRTKKGNAVCAEGKQKAHRIITRGEEGEGKRGVSGSLFPSPLRKSQEQYAPKGNRRRIGYILRIQGRRREQYAPFFSLRRIGQPKG